MDKSKKSWFGRHKILTGFLIFVAFIFIVAALDVSNDPQVADKSLPESTNNPVVEEAPLQEVSANQLYAKYKANEIAGDAEFKNKEIIVSGVVKDFSVVLGDSAIRLETNDILGGVLCVLNDDQAEKAGALAKGAAIKLKGTVTGYLFDVSLRRCEIL